MHEDVTKILFSEEQLQRRVCELGAQIARDYAGDRLTVVCVLRGAAIFASDLVRRIDLPVEMDFMAASSYGMEAESSGHVRIAHDLGGSVAGKHVLVVEDILDSGLTLDFLTGELRRRKAKSVEIAALLRKQDAQRVDVACKYVGFECPDEFIVGYGLDYAQRYRNLPYVGVLDRSVYETKQADTQAG